MIDNWKYWVFISFFFLPIFMKTSFKVFFGRNRWKYFKSRYLAVLRLCEKDGFFILKQSIEGRLILVSNWNRSEWIHCQTKTNRNIICRSQDTTVMLYIGMTCCLWRDNYILLLELWCALFERWECVCINWTLGIDISVYI